MSQDQKNESNWIWIWAQMANKAEFIMQVGKSDYVQLLNGTKLPIHVRRLSEVHYERKQNNILMHILPWSAFKMNQIDDESTGLFNPTHVMHHIKASKDIAEEALKAWIPERITPANKIQLDAEINKANNHNQIIHG